MRAFAPHPALPPGLDERTAVEDRARGMVDWIDLLASSLFAMQVRQPTRENTEILWGLKVARDAALDSGVTVQ